MVSNVMKQKLNNIFSHNIQRIMSLVDINKYEIAQKVGIGETQINCKLNPNNTQVFTLVEAKLICDELAESLDDMLMEGEYGHD